MRHTEQHSEKLMIFAKSSTILVMSNICLKAINFFLLPLYTKNLTPAMLGVSDSVTSLTGIVLPILVLGLDSAYSAFYFDKGDADRGKKVYSTLVFVFFVLGLLPIFFMPFAETLSEILFHTADYKWIVMTAFASVSFNLWYIPYSLELRLKNKMLLYGIVNIFSSLFMILLNVLFVSVLHMGEYSLVLSAMLVHLGQVIFFAIAVRQKPERRYFDKVLLKKMLQFSLPLIPAVIMGWILSLSDQYILLYYMGRETVGVYGIGLRFTNLLNVIISAVSTAYTTFAFSSREDKQAKQQFYYICNLEFLALLILSFSVSLFGKEIIMLLTDQTYADAYLPLRDLMFAQLLYAISTLVGYGIYFEKKSIYSLAAVSAGAVINLLLNIIFVPVYGIIAAAMTSFIGYLINFIIVYYFSEKLYPCNYGIKRIGASLCLLYIISAIAREWIFPIKVLIWTISIFVIWILFRSIIRALFVFLKKLLY